MKSTARNLLDRRQLLWTLVASNLKRQNKNSNLGYLWWFLDPLLTTGVYYLLFTVMFAGSQKKEDPFVLFIICGMMPWKAFGDSVGQSVGAVFGASGLIKSINFPKAVLPISLVLSNAVYFVFSLIVVFVVALAYGERYGTWPSSAYLALPLVILLQLIFTMGLSYLVSILGVFFMDTANIVGHIMQLWYFLSPGLYGVHRVPAHLLPWFRLNPFCGLMTSYRNIFMYHRFPEWIDLAYPLGIGLLTWAVGYALFRRFEGRVAQTL